MCRPRCRILPRCAAPGSDRADAGGNRSRAAPCSSSVPLTCDIIAEPVMQSLRSARCPAVACVTLTAYPSDVHGYGTSHGASEPDQVPTVPTDTEAAAALTLGQAAGFPKARSVAEAPSAPASNARVLRGADKEASSTNGPRTGAPKCSDASLGRLARLPPGGWSARPDLDTFIRPGWLKIVDPRSVMATAHRSGVMPRQASSRSGMVAARWRKDVITRGLRKVRVAKFSADVEARFVDRQSSSLGNGEERVFQVASSRNTQSTP